MKIAVITDDGRTISRHFGRASYYMVLTIEDQKITQRELREKLGHRHFVGQQEEHDHHDHRFNAATHDKHVNMASAISDCEVLICGGMGMGAYQSMKMLNIKPMVTDRVDIDEAVSAYLNGELVDRTDMLH